MKKTKTRTYMLLCPGCEHIFERRLGTLKGSTSCPRCKERFKRDAAVFDGDSVAARREIHARKHERNVKIIDAVKAPYVPGTIRGGQVPTSLAEAKFKAIVMERGWKPHRPSWPDFLIETDTGLIAVEVKSRNDVVSKTQGATFDILEANGLPVFIWHDTAMNRDTLIRWNQGQARKDLITTKQRVWKQKVSRKISRVTK